MAVSSLWEWVRGYVIIKVTGRMLEKFVNMAAARRIGLHDVTTLGPGMMLARVSIDDYRQLGPILRACGCWATVDQRVGAPFVLSGLARRKFLLFGLMIFVILLSVMSSVLWTIDIIGADAEQEGMIRQILYDMGITRWTPLSSVDCDDIRSEITKSVQGLAWVGAETQGTGLVLRVAGKVLPDAPAAPIDLIASEDSVIVRLIVLAGLPHVREGQTVAAGQVLVSGQEPTGEGGSIVHARAIVEGRVWREARAKVPLIVEQRVRTGRKAIQYRIVCGSIDLNLGRSGGFGAYDTKEYRRDLGPGVELIRIERHEIAVTTTRISRGEAYVLARAYAEESIRGRLRGDAKTLSVTENVSDEAVMGDAVEVVLIMETVEDIGIAKERL
jgi:similar to stage IV sporulation protein